MHNGDEYVHQSLKPRHLRAQLEEYSVTQTTAAALTRINAGNFSRFLSDQLSLSAETQCMLYRLLAFLEETQESFALPIDFNNLPVMQKRFTEFLQQRSAAEVIQVSAE